MKRQLNLKQWVKRGRLDNTVENKVVANVSQVRTSNAIPQEVAVPQREHVEYSEENERTEDAVTAGSPDNLSQELRGEVHYPVDNELKVKNKDRIEAMSAVQPIIGLPDNAYQNENDLPPPQVLANRTVNFQRKWYSDFAWLHYRPSECAVFCFPCTIADSKKYFSASTKVEPAFVSTGFRNWKKGREKFLAHEMGQQHLEAILKIQQEKSRTIETAMSEASTKAQSEAREALRVICSSLKYLARQGLPIQGHQETDGNFMELLRLRSNEVPVLKEWMTRPKSYTSHDIRNEICEIMAHRIQRKILSEIQLAGPFSIIVDETTDISTKEQVSICFRYVNSKMVPEERFLGLYETASTTSASLFQIILDVFKRFDLSHDHLRGQCFDGASNMSGKLNGVKAKFLELQPKAMYVHCFNHGLNLVLQDSSKGILEIRDVLSYMNDVSILICRSAKRLASFDSTVSELHGKESSTSSSLKPLCPTRWCMRVASIKSILNNYNAILIELENLGRSGDKCATQAAGLHSYFEKTSTFCLVKMCLEVFHPCEELSRVLQRPGATVSGAIEAALTVSKTLFDKKNRFDTIWEQTYEKATELDLKEPSLPRKRKPSARMQQSKFAEAQNEFSSPKEYLRDIFHRLIDSIVAEINRRFDQNGMKDYQKIESILLDHSVDLYSTDITEICQKYEIDHDKLCYQLKMFKDLKMCEFEELVKVAEAYRNLQPNIQGIFSEITKILTILLVVPASYATAERSFSMLRRLKTYLRTTMSQARLNNLAILHIYQDELDTIDITEIMKEFVSRNNFRLSQFGIA